MNKLAKIINQLSHEDALLIKKDLDKGNIDKLIDKRIKEAAAQRISLCPVCSTPVKEGEGIHIQFGPSDLRKKATFDGVDCLEYFLTCLKKK